MRRPVASRTALATAASGGTIGVSPTPLTPSGLVGDGVPIAQIVVESELPDMSVLEALGTFRSIVPTAKRVVVISWENFGAHSASLRPALQKGKFDTFLLMPRGARDEEFHYAITEMLSDWGATVATPVVPLDM